VNASTLKKKKTGSLFLVGLGKEGKLDAVEKEERFARHRRGFVPEK